MKSSMLQVKVNLENVGVSFNKCLTSHTWQAKLDTEVVVTHRTLGEVIYQSAKKLGEIK